LTLTLSLFIVRTSLAIYSLFFFPIPCHLSTTLFPYTTLFRSFGNVNARDLIQLKQSLTKIPALKSVLGQFDQHQIQALSNKLIFPEHLLTFIESTLVDDPPISITEGTIINDGHNETLDQYRDASRNGKQWIAELEKTEKEVTNIRSLKIGFNRVFGYYIEVTKANLHLLPEGRYERKQTLTNAERYITPELKE